MIELDGDEIRISSRGRYAERDIVQVQVHKTFLESKGHFVQVLFFKSIQALIPDSEGWVGH